MVRVSAYIVCPLVLSLNKTKTKQNVSNRNNNSVTVNLGLALTGVRTTRPWILATDRGFLSLLTKLTCRKPL